MTIGQTVKKARENKGMRQKQLADMLYVDPSLVCRWEKGQRQIMPDEMTKISEILEISLEEFENM